MSSCGHSDHCHPKSRFDFLFWGGLITVCFFYASHLMNIFSNNPFQLKSLSHAVFQLMNVMWWGIAIGAFFVGLIGKVPRKYITSALGTHAGFQGILRATAAGVLLDLCNHGILLIGMKLYERGASLGQTMAFLIASPWNSFSLTIILVALIGLKWTLAFIVLSALIAIASGLIFDFLVTKGVLPKNPNSQEQESFNFLEEAKTGLKSTSFNFQFFKDIIVDGISESRMIVRWLLLGVIIAVLIQTYLPTESFQAYFGPTVSGTLLTVFAATIIEVCSEGLAPIGADILNRAMAPGNGFAFLMAGVSTDYTEIISIKETTRSWKTALFLPIITLPQIIIVSLLLNLS